MRRIILTGIILFTLATATIGCAASNTQETAVPANQATMENADTAAEQEEEREEEQTNPLAAFPASDMLGYKGLRDYDKELAFVDMTVRDMADLMEARATFAVMASFADCPWCNAVIDNVNDAALEAGVQVGYINTRKDPSWSSNLDLEDYDIFTELVGDRLEYDSDNIRHLYVPHIFYIKEGKVVHDYQGALPEMGSDPNMELTPEQEEELTEFFREGFRMMEE